MKGAGNIAVWLADEHQESRISKLKEPVMVLFLYLKQREGFGSPYLFERRWINGRYKF
jgi:hypothetical protein